MKFLQVALLFTFVMLVANVAAQQGPKHGADCEWEGLIGKCVKETRCLTTLDEDSPKHPVCSRKDGESIICCTDCQLVDNTKNAVFSPTSGLYWKNGRKARDSCLKYLEELPYQCKQDGFYGGITRQLDEENKCFMHYEWAVEGEPAKNRTPSAKYPHQVMLGYGDDAQTAKWDIGGFIISDTYIVTVAHINSILGEPKFVAMGVKKRSDSPSTWQTHNIKRIIYHPDYDRSSLHNDIALIETDTPIEFDENVLPACLHVEDDVFVEDAVATSWLKLRSDHKELADTLQTIKTEEFNELVCDVFYGPMG